MTRRARVAFPPAGAARFVALLSLGRRARPASPAAAGALALAASADQTESAAELRRLCALRSARCEEEQPPRPMRHRAPRQQAPLARKERNGLIAPISTARPMGTALEEPDRALETAAHFICSSVR